MLWSEKRIGIPHPNSNSQFRRAGVILGEAVKYEIPGVIPDLIIHDSFPFMSLVGRGSVSGACELDLCLES
jgi:hypothetical protein